MDFFANLFIVAACITAIGGKAEIGEWIGSSNVLICMHKTRPVGVIASIAQVRHERVDAGFDKLLVRFSGSMSAVVMGECTMRVWMSTGDPRDTRRTT